MPARTPAFPASAVVDTGPLFELGIAVALEQAEIEPDADAERRLRSMLSVAVKPEQRQRLLQGFRSKLQHGWMVAASWAEVSSVLERKLQEQWSDEVEQDRRALRARVWAAIRSEWAIARLIVESVLPRDLSEDFVVDLAEAGLVDASVLQLARTRGAPILTVEAGRTRRSSLPRLARSHDIDCVSLSEILG